MKPKRSAKATESWPRKKGVFPHTPIFFAENKDRFLRQLLISDIEAATRRPLVVFFESPYFDSEIEQDDVSRLAEVLSAKSKGPIDLLLETGGGWTDAAEALTSLLRAWSDDLRVIVPMRAKSNGTMICLAAHQIMMGPTSELGPIEPMIGSVPVSILTTEEYKRKNYIMSQEAEYALLQTKSVARQLLLDGMMQDNASKIDETVDQLCSRVKFQSHGSVIDAAEAATIGLNVDSRDGADTLWKKFLQLHAMYAFDSQQRRIQKIFEESVVSQSVYAENGIR